MDCTETYMVLPGDTCNAISATYNLTANQIYVNNPQIDRATCNNLYVGEVLCVSQKTYAYPFLQLPSSSPNNAGQATQTPGSSPSNVIASASAYPAASTTVTSAPTASPTTTEEEDASEECDDQENTEEVEYCDEDDTSADCVDEEDLPYCDEQ